MVRDLRPTRSDRFCSSWLAISYRVADHMEEFVPYLRSTERYGFPRLDAFANGGPFSDNAPAEPAWRNCEEKVFLRPAHTPRFGPEYKHLFFGQDVDLILGATVIDLPADGSRGKTRVTSARCRSETGREILITANRFVLGAGAIDNPRLLLNSKNVVCEGLGNERDQVGRYLMDHPRDTITLIRVPEWPHWLARYALWRPYDGGTGFVGIRLREPQQLKKGILNSYTQLSLTPCYPWNGRPEIRAWRKFFGLALALLGSGRSLGGQSGLTAKGDFAHAAWQVVVGMPQLLRLVALRLMHCLYPLAPMIGLFNFAEMEPRPENRITLTDDRDTLDMPVPRVVLELSRRDLESLHRLHEQIATDLETMGCGGELVGAPEELAKSEWRDMYHYLGTTRMGVDPEHSVVNPDLRVHTVDNLYVAGGSVFPTSGCANPTMTIVALSIRLAEHLRATSASRRNS